MDKIYNKRKVIAMQSAVDVATEVAADAAIRAIVDDYLTHAKNVVKIANTIVDDIAKLEKK